ncbi:MAG TPA: hypothetical protein VEW69_12905, partial [Alphaproteobacteria bacterium]|nr:hypothetical protein [Alphaproteobacteria bacterium]
MAPSKITCILLAGLVIGCGQARNRVGINPPPPITGKLYVTNASTNAILRFDNAFTATGNMAPAATISGPATTLSNPRYIFLDTANDRLFVANNGGSSILIFDALSTKNGNVAPTRFIAGAGTSLATPVDVALDKTRDLLYVADGSSILVFATASTINGAIPPARTLSPGFTARAILL